jgi:P27 family predicted phage terminase small subunit
MGQRGVHPAPTALKVLNGMRPDRINDAEPVPAEQEVRCPTWLKGDARGVWRKLAPDLVAKGILTFWDVDLFARYCWLASKTKELMLSVDADGLTIQGDRGQVKNPAMQLLRDTTSQMVTIGARFGLTPSDRGQLSMPEGRNGKKGAERLLT